LLGPPQPIPARDVLPQTLPEAWGEETTTALEIANALSTKVGKMLPWVTVRDAIDGAFRARFLERESGSWPCDYAGARMVRICLPREEAVQQVQVAAPQPSVHDGRALATESGMLVAEASLGIEEIQNLSDTIGDLTKTAVGLNLLFHLRVELGPVSQVPGETMVRINELLGEVSDKLRLERG